MLDFQFTNLHAKLSNYFLSGAGTALLGKEAAMACTVAVEDVISEHYNKYILLRVLYFIHNS